MEIGFRVLEFPPYPEDRSAVNEAVDVVRLVENAAIELLESFAMIPVAVEPNRHLPSREEVVRIDVEEFPVDGNRSFTFTGGGSMAGRVDQELLGGEIGNIAGRRRLKRPSISRPDRLRLIEDFWNERCRSGGRRGRSCGGRARPSSACPSPSPFPGL
jgi:hypothetical protein